MKRRLVHALLVILLGTVPMVLGVVPGCSSDDGSDGAKDPGLPSDAKLATYFDAVSPLPAAMMPSAA